MDAREKTEGERLGGDAIYSLPYSRGPKRTGPSSGGHRIAAIVTVTFELRRDVSQDTLRRDRAPIIGSWTGREVVVGSVRGRSRYRDTDDEIDSATRDAIDSI